MHWNYFCLPNEKPVKLTTYMFYRQITSLPNSYNNAHQYQPLPFTYSYYIFIMAALYFNYNWYTDVPLTLWGLLSYVMSHALLFPDWHKYVTVHVAINHWLTYQLNQFGMFY